MCQCEVTCRSSQHALVAAPMQAKPARAINDSDKRSTAPEARLLSPLALIKSRALPYFLRLSVVSFQTSRLVANHFSSVPQFPPGTHRPRLPTKAEGWITVAHFGSASSCDDEIGLLIDSPLCVHKVVRT
jgi:hypothetical protein